jgi:hypothetical protein
MIKYIKWIISKSIDGTQKPMVDLESVSKNRNMSAYIQSHQNLRISDYQVNPPNNASLCTDLYLYTHRLSDAGPSASEE